jgi:Putative, 10TM heavy-metal exporter
MLEPVKTALMITAFVMAMMLLIEYLNVLSAGEWQKRLTEHTWGQYFLGAILGVTPGCLGAFAAVAMYSHGVLTLGALVTTMIAASGDEAFVMLVLIPGWALTLMAVLAAFGFAVGILVDLLGGRRRTRRPAECLELHIEDRSKWFETSRIVSDWKECTPERGTLAIVLSLFLAGTVGGQLGPRDWGWIRASLVIVSGLALFIAATVPNHFLQEHLWRHVARRHAPRIFLWTLGALLAMHILANVLHLEGAIRSGRWWMLLIACLVGLIPESGPHLVFVTLFAQGVVPLSVLLASSIVQDGHGMLPMLAHSVHEFVLIKAISFTAGLALGAAAMLCGW